MIQKTFLASITFFSLVLGAFSAGQSTVSLNAIPDQNVPAGKTLFVPVTAELTPAAPNASPVKYTVTSSNPGVTAAVHTQNRFLKMSLTYIDGNAVSKSADLIFALFPDIAPNTVAVIVNNLVNEHFYDGLTIHRVVPNFAIQGGDPNGNGSGGPGFTFADEFSTSAIFTGDGQLAMANSGPDTNGSQFFVTLGPQRSLDFKHTIFGQLVRGSSAVTEISQLPVVPGTERPVNRPVIVSATMITNNTDSVLMLSAPKNFTGSATITVVATFGSSSSTKTFTVNVAADAVNDPPFLPKPVRNLVTSENTPVTTTIGPAVDIEGDPTEYHAEENVGFFGPNAAVSLNTVANPPEVTITPNSGFVGVIDMTASVNDVGNTNPLDKRSKNFVVEVAVPRVLSVVRIANTNDLQITFSAEPGNVNYTNSYQVQGSDDLTNVNGWTNVGVKITQTSGDSAQVIDLGAGTKSQRYYRVSGGSEVFGNFSVVSPPFGFFKTTVPKAAKPGATGLATFSAPFFASPQATGQVTGVTLSTFSDSSATWTINQWASSAQPFLVKVMDGKNAGRFFRIVSNTSNTLTLDVAKADLTQLIEKYDRYEISPMTTVAGLFQDATGAAVDATHLQTGATSRTADTVSVFRNGKYVTYFNDGTNWKLTKGTALQNNAVITPEEGLFFTRRSSTDSLTLTVTGEASAGTERTNATGPGSRFLSNRFPVPIKLVDIGVQFLPGWLVSPFFAGVDTVSIWNSTTAKYEVYFHNGTNWQLSTSAVNADNTLIPAGGAFFIGRIEKATGANAFLEQRPSY